MADDFGKQIKLEAFRQHWEQIRHTENHRNTFTTIYGALVVAALAFIAQKGPGNYWYLFFALFIFSIFGLILCKRVKEAVEGHRERAKLIAGELIEQYEDKMERLLPYWEENEKSYSLRRLFVYLYGIMVFVFLGLFIYSIWSGWTLLVLGVSIFFSLVIAYDKWSGKGGKQ